MDVALSSEGMWESEMQKMKDAGHDVNDDVTYEHIREFHERGEHTIEVSREYQILKELKSHDAVMRSLINRKWALLKTDDKTGYFLTSDNPTMLSWERPETVPPMYRQSPGHAMLGTELYFPVSKGFALNGTFDGHEGPVNASRNVVAACNTLTVGYAYEQLYGVDSTFPVIDTQGEIVAGDYIVKEVLKRGE
jgi:hypothetical protein